MTRRLVCDGGAGPDPAAKVAEQSTRGDSTTTPHYGAWGSDIAGMDRTVKPGDRFYHYADGAALRAMQIPPDRSRYGCFDVLAELSENRVRAILETRPASAGAAPFTSGEKIGAFHKAVMDEAQAERLGASPLKADLEAVRAINSRTTFAQLMGRANDGWYAAFDIEPGNALYLAPADRAHTW